MKFLRVFIFASIFLSAFFLLKLPVFASPAVSGVATCEGYETSSGKITGNTVEKGICYIWTEFLPGYSADGNIPQVCPDGSALTYNSAGVNSCPNPKDATDPLPSCSDMTANDYHHDPNYHGITDNVLACPLHLGTTTQCCAPNDQSKAAAAVPPPPCTDFAGKPGSSACKSVNTAFGNIPTDPGGFVGAILGILLSISGGVALILIIAAGYQLMTSSGNPEKVKEARERLTSAIVGLLLIIFSLLILQTLTVNILKIPGFNF